MAELTPRLTFVSSPKRPVVVFHTSSRAKFAQAMTMFDIAGLRLTYRAQDGVPYEENYDGSKEKLLTDAIKEIRRRGRSSSYFFVEDTSIRIEALSADDDFPGLAAKEWFAEANFLDLHQQLLRAGDRRCKVKSGIALSVPGLDDPVFFYGETSGEVVEDLPTISTPNVFHPWLSADSFSSWFVPTGASKTLAEMSFEESLRYDFRGQAIKSLLDRLEEYSIALNLGTGGYSRRIAEVRDQPPLFSVTEPTLLVVGPTCSGKTTFGIHVQQVRSWHFIDASSIVKLMKEDRKSAEDIGKFATRLLHEEGPDVVARYIAHNMIRDASEPVIVTGFRAIEEVEFFRDNYPNVRVVSLNCPQRVRYQRFINRNSREARTFSMFQEMDEEQHRLGLLRVANELADVKVDNVYSEEDYAAQILKVLGSTGAEAPGVTQIQRHLEPDTSQLYRCLLVLRGVGRPLTTQEISAEFKDQTVRYNNANKILKRYPELATRQESAGSNVRYSITVTGLAFLGAVDRLARSVDSGASGLS